MNVQFHMVSQLGPEIRARAEKLPEQTDNAVSSEFQAMLEEMGLENAEDIPVADFSDAVIPYGRTAAPESSYNVTEEQAAYLSVRYDLSDMPECSEREKELLDELVKMNIISEEDARLWNFNCGGSVRSVSGSLYVRHYDGGEISVMPLWKECRGTSDNIIERLADVIDTQKNINGYYGENVGGADFLDSKERLLAVLTEIENYRQEEL